MPVNTLSSSCYRHAVDWGRRVHVSRSWQANHVRLQPFTSQPLIASDAQDQRKHHQCDTNEREPIALAAEILPIFVARDSTWQCDKNQATCAPCERDSRTLVRVYAELIKWHSTTATRRSLALASRSRLSALSSPKRESLISQSESRYSRSRPAPLRRFSFRFCHSRSNTSTKYSQK
jgi:hypothetical protein